MPTTKQKLFLSDIHLVNFKSIYDLHVEVKRGLNILIGKNGSGKSNFLEAISVTTRADSRSKFLFRSAFLTFVSSENHTLKIDAERIIKNQIKLFDDGQEEVESSDRKLTVAQRIYLDEKLVFNNQDLKSRATLNGKLIVFRNSIVSILNQLGFRSIRSLLVKFNIPGDLEFINTPGIIRVEIDDDFDILWDYNINGLNFINDLLTNLEDKYLSDNSSIKSISRKSILKNLSIDPIIKERLKRYSPIQDLRFNENINVYPEEKIITIENLKLDFKVNGTWLPWSQLSDGTKRLFYLIVEITIYNGTLILVEEPELGVHPHQFDLIMEFLKEISESKTVIISTHSPLALNHLTSDQLSHVLITSFNRQRGTQIKNLTKAQEKKAKLYMKDVGQLSDYWMLSDLE
jgi:AAA15 family ATPase/GTPase